MTELHLLVLIVDTHQRTIECADNRMFHYELREVEGMSCVHLKELFQLCEKNDLRLGGSDLIRIVCRQCGEQEVCPSMLDDEYDARHPEEAEDSSGK